MGGDERGTRLLASVWSLTAAAAILLSIRVYCKIWRGRGLWWDDNLLIISMVSLNLCQGWVLTLCNANAASL